MAGSLRGPSGGSQRSKRWQRSPRARRDRALSSATDELLPWGGTTDALEVFWNQGLLEGELEVPDAILLLLDVPVRESTLLRTMLFVLFFDVFSWRFEFDFPRW